MGAGFSRACLEKSSRDAVRPQEKNCEESKWVAGIGEDGEEILEDVMEEPDNAGVDDANMRGKRRVRKFGNPLLPSEEEVREHETSHLPYRSWCPHCIKGRGKEMGHMKQVKVDSGVPEYHVDYCFPGDEMGHKLTILVGVERYSGMKMCSVVPTKGRQELSRRGKSSN